MKQPLENIKILDLSRVYAAPAGTMLLGDLGADVIRIESINGTDSMREWGPFVNGQSTYYLSANRNKRSITLNLKQEKGKKIFLELVKNSDVVVENFKTGTMERLGLSYDELKKVNDQLIMCSVTGFGQTGPLKEEPGFDPVIQAMSGLMDVTGYPDGSPTKVGIPITDILTSNYVAISILAAIRTKELNSIGQHIDLSLLDVQISSLANVSSTYLNKNIEPKRMGNAHNNVVPYQVFNCQDEPIILAVGNNQIFKNLCQLLKYPQWITNPKFNTNDKRLENRKELILEIQEVLLRKKADTWLRLFSESKIPAGKVNTIKQAFMDPQIQSRDTVEVLTHPIFGNIKMTRNPMRFSKLNIKSKYAPPVLGEHTNEVLMNELGYCLNDIEILKKENIISSEAGK